MMITKEQILSFTNRAEIQMQAQFRVMFDTLQPPNLTFTLGQRYAKLIKVGRDDHDRSVFCFVDLTNGDVLKAASWKVPAKHSRGNIFDSAGGLDALTWTGAKYIR